MSEEYYMNKGKRLEHYLFSIGNNFGLDFKIEGIKKGENIQYEKGEIDSYENAARIARQEGSLEKTRVAAKKAIKLYFLFGEVKKAERTKKEYGIEALDYLKYLEEAIADHKCFGGDEKIIKSLEKYKMGVENNKGRRGLGINF